MKILLICLGMLCPCVQLFAQQNDSLRQFHNHLDSLYIASVESGSMPLKILHAEPLFIDLIRDLGARKGEREWNIGMQLTDNLGYDAIGTLIEYEFAPLDRLGLEVELPFTFYSPQKGRLSDSLPSNRLESLKLASQWTFHVSKKQQASFALGYIHEFLLPSFRDMRGIQVRGHLFNPFLIVAKRWGDNWHSLMYTGPRIEKEANASLHFSYEANSNIHYMIPGTRNFVGVEFNKSWARNDFDMVIRPQMRLGIFDNLLIGIVGGVPVRRENQRLSMFTRLIWEPGHGRK